MREESAGKDQQTNMMNAETSDKAAAIAAQGAHVAPEKAISKKGVSQKKGVPKAKKPAKAALPKKQGKPGKKAAKPTRPNTATRAESKGAKILALISHTKGATLAEIMKATDWQAHSVRGFISTSGKKYKVNIESAKNEAGERVYRIAK
jgi:hypothetical protein